MPVKTEELLKRMSAYKRQSHMYQGQLAEAKRKNANLNERCTKAEAKVARQAKLIERLEEEHILMDDPAEDLELPNTIDEEDPESGAPWVLDDEPYDSWQGSDFIDDSWEASDYDENEEGY